MTAQDLITASFKRAGLIPTGETPSSEESADALIQLNEIIGNWSAVGLQVFGTDHATYALSSGVGTYTIGPGGAFNTTRPLSITQANIILSNGMVFPLKIGSEMDLSSVLERSTPVLVPRFLYLDGKYPLSTIFLAPVPSGTPTLEIFSWQVLASLAALGSTFDMPPGYELALVLTLAVSLCPSFGRPVEQQLGQDALNARAAIRGLNAPPSPGHAQEAQAAGAASPVDPGNLNTVSR